MTRQEAMAEMTEGYCDGLRPDSPEPSANRSASYRHGFRNGRSDRAGVAPFSLGRLLVDSAHAIAEDITR